MTKANTSNITVYPFQSTELDASVNRYADTCDVSLSFAVCSLCGIKRDFSCFYKKDNGEFRRDCKICHSKRMAEYRDKNKNTINENKKVYYIENRDKVKSKVKEYYINNKRVIFAKYREKYQNNIEYALKHSLRNRLNTAVKNNHKSGSAVSDLGCTIEELKTYLESKFQTGMTWENWSRCGWHIDHIIPLSAFDLTDSAQLKKACHYSNLQPLWAKDNIRKSNND